MPLMNGPIIIALVLSAFAATSALGADGTRVYRCVDARGHVTFSQLPCAEDAREVDTRDALRTGTAPNRDQYNQWLDDQAARKAEVQAREQAQAAQLRARQPPPVPPSAWRCEASDGSVFYRHDGCPAAIPTVVEFWADGYPVMGTGYAPVRAVEVDREQACDSIYARRSGDRAGSDRDQRYSPYDRRAGRDPCK